MATFTNDGLSLYYETHGKGRPVMFLHGGMASFKVNYAICGWIDPMTERGMRVIGMDARGHGESDKPHDPNAYGTVKIAGDVLALLDHLGHERVSLVGYSIGTTIALHLLHEHPERFARTALVATGDGMIGILPYTFPAILPVLAETLRRPEFPADLPPHVAMYWTFATEIGGDRLAGVAGASGHYPPMTPEEAATIQTPILVISGDQDPVLGTGRRLAQTLGNARYLELEGADHFSLAVDPRAQKAVAEFLAEPVE